MTRTLTVSEWNERAVPARDRVFAMLDPFDAPFSNDVTERGLLFPVSYDLEPAQIAVVRAAAKGVGDESIFLESLVASTPDASYWEFSVDGEGPYDVIEFVLENVIFSSTGKWGMTISEEDHAVIGGVPGFMRTIAQNFPATASPTQHMVRHPTELEVRADASFDEIWEEIVAQSDVIPMATDQPFGDGQALAFISFWKAQSSDSLTQPWLPGLLRHIFGAEHADRLLRMSDWE